MATDTVKRDPMPFHQAMRIMKVSLHTSQDGYHQNNFINVGENGEEKSRPILWVGSRQSQLQQATQRPFTQGKAGPEICTVKWVQAVSTNPKDRLYPQNPHSRRKNFLLKVGF